MFSQPWIVPTLGMSRIVKLCGHEQSTLLVTPLEMLVLQAWRRLLNYMVRIISGC